jgi:hypothetical protein
VLEPVAVAESSGASLTSPTRMLGRPQSCDFLDFVVGVESGQFSGVVWVKLVRTQLTLGFIIPRNTNMGVGVSMRYCGRSGSNRDAPTGSYEQSHEYVRILCS